MNTFENTMNENALRLFDFERISILKWLQWMREAATYEWNEWGWKSPFKLDTDREILQP